MRVQENIVAKAAVPECFHKQWLPAFFMARPIEVESCLLREREAALAAGRPSYHQHPCGDTLNSTWSQCVAWVPALGCHEIPVCPSCSRWSLPALPRCCGGLMTPCVPWCVCEPQEDGAHICLFIFTAPVPEAA